MAPFRRHIAAIWNKQCPRCFQGAIYKSGMQMHARCPVCDLLFEREQGYFMGALYISYALATAILGTAAFALHVLLPDWNLGLVLLIVAAAFLPVVPAVTRYARIIWIHFDRWAWPDLGP